MSQQLFIQNTPLAIALALAIVGLLACRVTPSTFRSLSWQSVGIASALFWGVFAAILVSIAWGFYYSFFAPSWYLFAAPLGAVVLYSCLGLILRWVALRLPGNPVVWFCVLGGLESIPEHAIGIYRFHILEIPILRGSNALSIFVFACFEYVLYWSVALALAFGVDQLRRIFRRDASRSQGLVEDASG